MKKISVSKTFFTVLMTLLFSVVLVACESNEKVLADAVANLEIGFVEGDSANSITRDVTLPTSVNDVQVVWQTSDDKVITTEGVVTRVYGVNQTVKLTATLTLKDVSQNKEFDLVVLQLVDAIPPAFMGAVGGRLNEIKHLAGETVDLLEGIQARDNIDGYDVDITVDTKEYDNTVANTYTVTYTATDKSNNKTTIDRTIIVEPSLDVTLSAAIIGDSWIEYAFNDTDALKSGGTFGATFRQQDKLQVMEKSFFEAELVEHAAEYPNNNGIPVLPYGSVIVTDKDLNIVHARFQTGVYLQMDVVEGETITSHTDVIWNQDKTGIAGGSALTGLVIPEGGYVMFAPSMEPQKARIFVVSNLFASAYTGGAATKDIQDVFDLTEVKIELVEEHRVLIPLPAPVATPEITLNRHTLSWTEVANVAGYQLYVNGQAFGDVITSTQVDLSTLELAISEDEGYNIQVEAITKDVFKWSNSPLSNTIQYKKIEIQTLGVPVVTIDEQNPTVLTWEAVEGTNYYEVYFVLNSIVELVGTTETTSFDVKDFTGYNGVNGYYVKGIGLMTHSDSLNSAVVYVDQTVTTTITLGTMTTEVIVTTAKDYFARRNLTNNSKLGTYLYLVKELETVTAWSGANIEAFSTVVILNSEYKAKVVRNILGQQTYTKELGWFTDTVYANNGNQTVGFGNYVTSGDMLLIGKNGLNISYTVSDSVDAKTAAARDFVAYHYVNQWETFPTTPSTGGWRSALTANFDSSSVEMIFA